MKAVAAVLLLVMPLAVPSEHGAPADTGPEPVVERFLAGAAPAHAVLRAVRHLEASTRQGTMRGWIDACTELDGARFRYEVIAQGGSGAIRSRVLLPALEAERRAYQTGDVDRSALSRRNYEFSDASDEPDGLVRVRLRPLRKDPMLVEGAIFLKADDGDLVRVEGRLAKRPSFWTRRVDIVRRYARIGGARLPVSMESMANVLIVGAASFSMTYDYHAMTGEAGTTIVEDGAQRCGLFNNETAR